MSTPRIGTESEELAKIVYATRALSYRLNPAPRRSLLLALDQLCATAALLDDPPPETERSGQDRVDEIRGAT